jgi:hypothetical protein
MLKPSAAKLATSASAADLIAAFLSKGGNVSLKPVAVAAGLRKTRYVKRIAKIKLEAVA